MRLHAPLAPVNGAHARRDSSIVARRLDEPLGRLAEGARAAAPAPADGVRKILLLTDGHANVGITDRRHARRSSPRRAAGERIGTTTIGIGSDFDEELLTRMADAGGGNAHYAETADAAPAIFAASSTG